MKRCWDPNPDNRPNATERRDEIELFTKSSGKIAMLFEEAYKYKRQIFQTLRINK